MKGPQPALYKGTVTHKRLRPVVHELRYDVASLLVDVDDLGKGRHPSLLGYNRFNLMSVFDADHGDKQVAQSLSAFAWGKVNAAGLAGEVKRILMLCYPRILGYAFNPLTTYYALDADGHTRLLIYEVHNTFGGRHSYVSDPIAPGEAGYFTTEKLFRVSPFNGIEGHYGLRASEPGDVLTVGVALTTAQGPLLNAYFHGRRLPLDNRHLIAQFLALPFMSLKVIGGIHWEALKLWLKGLNLQKP